MAGFRVTPSVWEMRETLQTESLLLEDLRKQVLAEPVDKGFEDISDLAQPSPTNTVGPPPAPASAEEPAASAPPKPSAAAGAPPKKAPPAKEKGFGRLKSLFK